MQIHKYTCENETIYTFFDSKKRAIFLTTKYLIYLRRIGRPATSINQIAHIIKLHCEWIEKTSRFRGIKIDQALSYISGEDIIDWINEQRKAGISENTIRNREVLIRKMYDYFKSYETGLRTDTPWSKGYFTRSQSKKIPRYISTPQFIKLLQGMHYESQRVAAQFVFDTGVRVSELVRLTKGDLPKISDFPSWYNYFPMRIAGSKSYDGNAYKDRETIISLPVLQRILEYHSTRAYLKVSRWKKSDPKKPLFLNTYGEQLSTNSFYKTIKKAWERATGEKSAVSPHWLRHSTAYSVLRSEICENIEDGLLIAKGMYGHSNISSTEIYFNVPIIAMDSLNKQRQVNLRYKEAEEIYNSTYLTSFSEANNHGNNE